MPPIEPLLLAQKGSLFLTRPTLCHYIATREGSRRARAMLFAWIAAGELKVARSAPSSRSTKAAEAHRALEARQTTGKVLLIP